jgi:biopolymer transport protein ExbB/biopolymer transport protein TolQ
MNMSLEHLWASMGWFAKGIVITLIFMSIMVAYIAIRKLIQLGRSRRATIAFSPKFSKALASENFEEAAKLVDQHPKSHLATAFRRVFPSLEFHSADWQLTAVEISSVQRLIELNTIEQLARFRRGLGILATVGATAPFVGLLGTTMGVVNAFSGMATGGGGIGAISAGIAEALITTAIGLGAALPGVWLYNYFINRIDYLSMEVNYTTKEFMDFLIRYEAGLENKALNRGNTAMLESGKNAVGAQAAADRARMGS